MKYILKDYETYKKLEQLNENITVHDDEVSRILDMLEKEIPFSFARFNDGEMMGIKSSGVRVARQDQIVTPSLQQKLTEAIKHEQENYWVGLPCLSCFPEHRILADSLVSPDYKFKTTATCTTNRNWLKFICEFSEAVKYRQVFWISGEDQNIDVLENTLNIPIYKTLTFPQIDSWDRYDEINQQIENEPFEAGDVVCLSCGPMSRVFAKEWFESRPDVTFLDVGSTFDPFARGVFHNCHKGWLETGFNHTVRCQGCN